MKHLREVIKREIPVELAEQFPFNLEMIRRLERLELGEVTLLVGENGSGKSTILEGIAAATNLPIVGSRNLEQDVTLRYAVELGKQLKLVWSIRQARGFFLRAEDFFGFTKRLNRLKSELEEEKKRLNEELPEGYGKHLAVGAMMEQIEELKRRYGVDLDAGSHGESFLRLFQSRIKPGGLYLLDEPEAPLSPTRVMALMLIVKEMVEKDCQFVIATHSPILMAYPGAVIYNFDQCPPTRVKYEEVNHVQTLRNFVVHPEEYLRQLGF